MPFLMDMCDIARYEYYVLHDIHENTQIPEIRVLYEYP